MLHLKSGRSCSNSGFVVVMVVMVAVVGVRVQHTQGGKTRSEPRCGGCLQQRQRQQGCGAVV